jgi:hypothetical protein
MNNICACHQAYMLIRIGRTRESAKTAFALQQYVPDYRGEDGILFRGQHCLMTLTKAIALSPRMSRQTESIFRVSSESHHVSQYTEQSFRSCFFERGTDYCQRKNSETQHTNIIHASNCHMHISRHGVRRGLARTRCDIRERANERPCVPSISSYSVRNFHVPLRWHLHVVGP